MKMPEVPSTDKLVRIIHLLNIATGVIIFGFGLAGLIFMAVTSLLSGKLFLILSPIFMMIFGIVLIATECKVQIILKKFGFLQTLIGRGIFNIYLASEVFFYFSCGSNNEVGGWILGLVLFSMGLLYIVLHFCAGTAYTQDLKERLA